MRNDFLEFVTAGFSADGKNGNPDPATFDLPSRLAHKPDTPSWSRMTIRRNAQRSFKMEAWDKLALLSNA